MGNYSGVERIMSKMPKSLPGWLIPKLRRISLQWPGKQIARDRAKRQVQIGFFKNGKPEYRTVWQCAKCLDLFEKEETQMDHINPVVDVKGFKTWDAAIPTLFCPPENYQCLCKACHYLKTQLENEQREKNRKIRKKT